MENLALLNQLKSLKRNDKLRNETLSTHPSNYLNQTRIDGLLTARKDDVIAVPKLSVAEFRSFVERNSWRLRESYDVFTELESTDEYKLLCEFINVMGSKKVVDTVNDRLFSTDLT